MSKKILLIQEKFDLASNVFDRIITLANSWNTTVDLIHYISLDEELKPHTEQEDNLSAIHSKGKDLASMQDEVLRQTAEAFAKSDRLGSTITVTGSEKTLLEAIKHEDHYRLIIVGDVFLSKPPAPRIRLRNALQSYLIDQLKIPVVGTEELEKKNVFSPKHIFTILKFLIPVLVIYILVFSNQAPVMRFLSPDTTWERIVTALCVLIFSPLIAFLYGMTGQLLLKLFKLE